MSFREALEKVLKHEGGYVNDKNDLGGETNLGVTKNIYAMVYGTRLSSKRHERFNS